MNGGSVISTSINKYSYITLRKLPPFFEYKYRIRYYHKEEVNNINQIEHPSVRECCKYLQVEDGIEMVHNADLPARSGLGSSSTFTVGMLHSLHTLKNNMPTKRVLADQAIHVEQEIIKEAVGSQDQVAVAFGGFNRIFFKQNGGFEVEQLIIKRDKFHELQNNLLLCFTGFARTAADIAKLQIRETRRKSKELEAMIDICDEAFKILTSDTASTKEFGKLLNEQWKIKKNMSDLITSQSIDDIYELGIKNGAIGGKLLGAGGGGFILFYAEQHHHANIIKSLNRKMFVPFRFEDTGSKIIYHSYEEA